MSRTADVAISNLLQKKQLLNAEEAEKFVSLLNDKQDEAMLNLKEIFLTKEDKIDLINKMDSHFKWLAGIMISTIAIAVGIIIKFMH